MYNGFVSDVDEGKRGEASSSCPILESKFSVEELCKYSGCQVEELLPGLLGQSKSDLFRWVVSQLVHELDIDCALIGELSGPDFDRIQTLVISDGGSIVENISYELEGTPCQEVVTGDFFYCLRDVSERFPQDELLVEMGVEAYIGLALVDQAGSPLGIFVLLNRSPMSEEQGQRAGAMMRLLQPRIETEFCYRRAMRTMELIASSALSVRSTMQQLVSTLAKVVRMKCVYVAIHDRGETSSEQAWVLASNQDCYLKGTFSLRESPCAGMKVNGKVSIRSQAKQQFNNKFLDDLDAQSFFAVAITGVEDTVIGHVGLIHDRPVQIDLFNLPLFHVVVERMAAELRQGEIEKKRLDLERRLAKQQHHDGLGILAGGIAHDFNNLLVAIGGPAEMIKVQTTEDSDVQFNVETILEAAKQAAELCKQLLLYAGNQPTGKVSFDLNALIAKSQRIASMYTSNSSVMDYQLTPVTLPVLGCEIEIQQAIMNLIKNAADATVGGGTIRVETALQPRLSESFAGAITGAGLPAGNYAQVRVVDHGSGMAAEDIPRVFERFFTTKESGHGIGLSVVISSIAEHGGALEVYSEVGKGTVFTISLPIT